MMAVYELFDNPILMKKLITVSDFAIETEKIRRQAYTFMFFFLYNAIIQHSTVQEYSAFSVFNRCLSR